MNPIDLSLYLVLDPDLCGGPEGMVRTARVAAENGVTVVQLRAPGWKKKQWLETARELKAVLAPLGVPLIINDQVDVALAVDAEGVHIGQDDLPVAQATGRQPQHIHLPIGEQISLRLAGGLSILHSPQYLLLDGGM